MEDDKKEIKEKELKNVSSILADMYIERCPHCKKLMEGDFWTCPYCGQRVR